jgi:hypothetical protein
MTRHHRTVANLNAVKLALSTLVAVDDGGDSLLCVGRVRSGH